MVHNPITYTEIKHWAEGEGYQLTRFERKAIRAIDRAFITFQNTQSKDKK